MARTTVLTIIALSLVAAVVVYSSLGLGTYRCEVCIAFEGREACRTVEAADEAAAETSARNNACAHIASGVTDMMRCERTMPTRLACEEMR